MDMEDKWGMMIRPNAQVTHPNVITSSINLNKTQKEIKPKLKGNLHSVPPKTEQN
jgi:hypothetical protein